MANRTAHQLPPATPTAVVEDNRRQLSRRELQALEALLALRTTAEHVDYANASQMRPAFASLSSDELTMFTALLQRVREGFAGTSGHVSRTCRNPERGSGEDVFSSRDPLTSLIMRADGVSEGDLRATLGMVATARSTSR